MPKHLLCWIAVSLFLLMPAIAPAQSLFYETQKIKKILDQRALPTVYATNFLSNWSVTLNDELQDHKDTFQLREIGRYHLQQLGSTNDTLYIAYGDSVVPVLVSQIIQIDNMPNAVAWTLRSAKTTWTGNNAIATLTKTDETPWEIRKNLIQTSADPTEATYSITEPGHYSIRAPASFELSFEDSTRMIELAENTRLIVELSNSGLSFHQVSDFQVGTLSKPDFYELMTFLAIHSEYQEKTFGLNTLENVYKKYQDNPFLAPLLDTLLYSYNFEAIAPFLDFDEIGFGKQVEKELTEYYPWIANMYGNPEFDNKTQVLEEKDVSYYAALDPDDKSSIQQLQTAAQRANSTYTKVSALDQTSIIVGLSDFIAERAQEELNITFMDRFKRRLEDRESNEFSVLFPRTSDLFLQFEISNYKKLLQNARPDFANDLQNLGLNLPNLLKMDKYKDLLNYSTELYNLALFYQVTNLVYNERPIEDILVTSFQQMERRKQDMREIINLSLADTVIKASRPFVPLKENKKYTDPDASPQVNAKNPLIESFNQLPQEVIAYNKEIAKAYAGLVNNEGILKGYLIKLRRQVDRRTAPQLYQAILELDKQMIKSGKLSSRFDYQVPEVAGTHEAFDYYEHFAANNLDGKGYFGYYLNETTGAFDHYKKFFSKDLSEKAYKARGLELTRLMLDEGFDEAITDWRVLLAEISPKARAIQEQIILREREALDTLINQVTSLRTAIDDGINEEINFWQSKKKWSDTTDIDLAALRYLSNLIDDEEVPEWVLLSQLQAALTDEDTSFFRITLEEEDLSREDVLQKHKQADRELERIYHEVTKRIDALKKKDPSAGPPANSGLQSYLDIRKEAISFGTSRFADLTKVDTFINVSRKQVHTIREMNARLRKKLVNLDQGLVPTNLTEALKSSADLATAVELSVHLLYSLKKEEKVVTPMLRDTSMVEYTITNRNISAGVDSSTVINKESIEPIKEGVLRREMSWLKKESFDSIMLDPQGRAIFLGLLYQQLKALKGSPEFSTEGLATVTTNLINTIYRIESDRNALDQKKLKEEKISFRDYYPFIQTTVDLFSTVVETPIYKDNSLAQRFPTLGSVTKVAQQGLSLYNNIEEKQYGYAIYNAMEIFRLISDAERDRQHKYGKKKYNAEGDRIRNAVILYGTFMADVTNARSSDQVKEALKAAASPPGSSRLKRELVYNMSVNSYLGAGFGLEKLNTPAAGSNQSAFTLGLSVPVGLAFSWKAKAAKNSFSFFVPVLDIGAVTYFRLNDKNASKLPELSFKNFIAPGAFLFYNLHDSPFTFGGGWQYGPQIRGTSLTDPDQTSSASRFVLFAGIDVPLFNLANGPRSISYKYKNGKKPRKKRSNSNPPKSKKENN